MNVYSLRVKWCNGRHSRGIDYDDDRISPNSEQEPIAIAAWFRSLMLE